MALRDLLFDSGDVATATPATVGTPKAKKGRTIAEVATVAVATAENSKTSEPDSRLIPDPAGRCPNCGSGQYWQLPCKPWRCRECEPMSDDISRRATTLTPILPCACRTACTRTRRARRPI